MVQQNTPDSENELYAKREKIFPRRVTGTFALTRTLCVVLLLGLYYILPWIEINGIQAVLFDIPKRQFHILGLTFWPQDFIYLTAFLIIAALSLFLFTAIAGRLWCGYACPQTVWTEVFLWIERKVIGDRNRQIRLNESPWNIEKLRKVGLLHFCWITFSLWTGLTFVGYFTPIQDLTVRIVRGDVFSTESFWILFYGFATYGNAGWLREQVCTYMCPYARFQSAMFDPNTLIISYNEQRGDPRGSRKKGEDYKTKNLGDCVDCGLCVQVCPTGIDIRDGLQYQCIGCAACVDVCDSVMEKLNYPKGLVSYTTENNLKGQTNNFLRPRIIIYTAILLGLISALVIGIATRNEVDIDVLRARSPMYRLVGADAVENIYTIKLMNKDTTEQQYRIDVDDAPHIHLLLDNDKISVKPNKAEDVIIRVRQSLSQINKEKSTIKFRVCTVDNSSCTVEKSTFIAPNE